MSVLAYPRIHFRGRCLINPPTANNDDVMVDIDAVNVRIQPGLDAMDDVEARRWIIEELRAVSPINGNLHTYLRCAWNYFGESSVRFQDVEVCSVVGNDGRVNTRDPIVGRGIRLLGSDGTRPVICDVDPTGVAITQIFLGGLTVGDQRLGLRGTYDTRAYSRWIGWRNAAVYQGEQNFVGAGATWQFAIPSDNLEYHELAQSPLLRELADAAGEGQGIQVQFCFYLARPYISDADLHRLFKAGFEPSNPAEAYMVGTIGVWETDELMTAMCERLLRPTTDADPTSTAAPLPFGPAAARLHPHREVVSLNLITTFPEADYHRPPDRKAYIGPVRLGLIPPHARHPIAISDPIAYGNASYLLTAGIVDVPYYSDCATTEQLEAGDLVLLADRLVPIGGNPSPCQVRQDKPILTEAGSIFTLETDDQAIYLDVDEADKIEVLVRERGGPPGRDMIISLWEYQFVVIPPGPHHRATSALTMVAPGTGLSHRIRFDRHVRFPAHQDTPLPIPIEAKEPGALTLAFTLDGKPPGADFPNGGVFYMGVRVLPDDDYCDTPEAERRSWPFMYHTVFRYYHMIYPAMSKIIPFNNQKVMEAAAPELVRRTDPGLWDTTRYMPITRDLSEAKRQLIVDWANSLPKGGHP